MNPKTVEWSTQEIVTLIYSVKNCPVLYNNSQFSSNRLVSDKLWKVIAVKIPGKTAQNCVQKWRYLKSGFIKRHNSEKLVKWPYYEMLTFLNPYIQNDGGAMLNRSVRIIPQPQPSTSTSTVNNKTLIRVKDIKTLKPESRKRSRGDSPSTSPTIAKPEPEPQPKKSAIAILFERIEKDILALPAHEQYDFEIQIMTIFRDKLKKYGTNRNY